MATVMERYMQFSDKMNDENAEPVKVFNPLSQEFLDELVLIREVSKTLQQKKDDELARAAAQAAKEAENKQEKKQPEPEVKKEEVKEENVKQDS